MGIVKIALMTSAALCMGAICSQAHAQDAQKTYNLPEQDLATALRSVARGSDYQLVADPKSLKGARAPSLAGAYTVEEAVAALLAPSGLTAEIRDRTITLRGREAPSREEVTGATDVLFSVTGTRIRGAKPTAPVLSSSREKIAELGYSDLGSFARSIPQNFSGGQNPGVISSVQTGSENVNSSSALNLRGLGPDTTLTLLNGHRLAYDAASQGVDISAIPLAAIDRIEVVADGSSALYGSDAVGGVANIILRREYDGLLTSVRLGAATEGGNFQQQYSAVSGAHWSGGGMMLAGDFSQASDITAAQRDLTANMEPGTTLLPSQRQISAILAGHQRLGDGAEFEIDAHYNNHRSRAALPFSATAPVTTGGNLTRSAVESYSVSPSVTFHLPADWDVTARATRAVSDTQIDGSIFSGGVRFAENLIRYKNDLWSAEISGDGPLFAFPGGDVRLALGAGLRSNGLAASVRSVRAAGTFNLVNYLDSQTAIYGFGEVVVPLVSDRNALLLIQKLQLSGALRYERYDHLGGLATPKIGILYQPVDALMFKGSWGKSFKAPTLSQRNTVQQGYTLASSEFTPSPATAGAVLVLAGGSRNLAPERATTLTLTAEFAPRAVEGLSLQASYFHVRYKGRVVSPIADDYQSFRSEYADLVLLNPSLTEVLAATTDLPLGVSNQTDGPYDPAGIVAIVHNQLQNAARQKIQGVDVTASYAFRNGANAFSVETNASYLKSDQRLSASQPSIERAGTIFNPPHWRARTSAGWQRGNIGLTASHNYIGGTTDGRTTQVYKVDSFQSVDLSANIKFDGPGLLGGWSFLLSAQNLFNEMPSLIRTSGANSPPYDATNYSSVGRFVSLTISKAW
jgi:outer membrane receptor protein involved in Fe transport